MIRLGGYTLFEALTVLAIVAVASAASLQLIRQTGAEAGQDFQEYEIARLISLTRARAVAAGEPREVILPVRTDCGSDVILAFADGSVSSGRICQTGVDETARWFTVNPIDGRLDP